MCKTDEAKRSHRQRQVVAAESGWHPGEPRYMKYAWVAAVKQISLIKSFCLVSSACRAAPMGPFACGHSASRGVSPPTGCTTRAFGPCRSTRPLLTFILEEGTKRSTALTCVTQTSVCSSVRRRLPCSK